MTPPITPGAAAVVPLITNGRLPSPVARSRRSAKRWVSLGLAVLALAAVAIGYRSYVVRQATPRYRLARVERGPLTASVAATGNLNAVITVLVGSQVSGTIKELHADFNTVVHTGQVIAQIDPALFAAAVTQAQADVAATRSMALSQEAQLDQARTGIENARAEHAEARAQTAKAAVTVAETRRALARQIELASRQLIATAELDTAQTAHDAAVAQHEAAEAHERAVASSIQTALTQLRVATAALETARSQVEQKQATLAQAQINLDHATIRSPVDGVVVNRAVDVGQTVAATLQAPTLFTIAKDLTKMQVETSVDEADIGRIGADTPVTFTVDSFRGQRFAGRVSQIRKAPQVVQNVVTYTVVVAVDNPKGTLLPGMTANVRFITAHEDDVIKVPNTALRFRPPDATKATSSVSERVWVLDRHRQPVAVPVTVGLTDGTSTQIVRGDLAVAQEIVVGIEEAATTPAANTAVPRLRF